MDTNQKLEIAKMVLRWTSKLGTGAIISGVVHQVTEPETLTEQVKIGVGSFMLGGLVAGHVGAYSDELFDETVDNVNKLLKWNQERIAAKQSA